MRIAKAEIDMKRMLMPVLASMVALSMSASAQPVGYKETGLAAVYADALDGHVTASGQIYDKAKLTTAHKTLPYGTKVKVTNPKNNKSVILLVNDRGPVQAARILDISPAAASGLGFSSRGVRKVTLEVVEVGSGKTTRAAHQ
jgi:rare lipoprotein A